MDLARYNRQMILPDFGTSAQEKLAISSVLVVGAGGLGCPVLQILVSTGIGVLGIVDFDTVELQNLHRQFLYSERDVGTLKVIAALKRLKEMNSDTEIVTFQEMVTTENIFSIIYNFDIVVDCTDNFATRYLLSDACSILKKPLVHASIFRYEAQISVFNVQKDDRMTNYRDLFPVPPDPDEVQDCREAGVLPSHSCVIGTFQANEVIKLLINSNETLVHQLLIFNTQNYQTMKINFKENRGETGPNTIEELQKFNYEEFCNRYKNDGINSEAELRIFLSQKNSILIDVREIEEQPELTFFNTIKIPLDSLEQNFEKLDLFESLCFICASGIRSRKALGLAKKQFPEKEIKHFSSGAKSILQ